MMSKPIILKNLEQNLTFFNKMYDVVRIVDPINKRVMEYRDNKITDSNNICYDYWKSGKICDNCISVRSYHDNKSYMKLEQSIDLIMLVTAFPVETAGEPVVLELLKNATDTMMIGTGNYNEGQAMRNVVYEINNMVVRDHLTLVFNRRYVDDRLPIDIVRSTIAQQPLTLIFIDIDNMKMINDTYGHAAGDLLLKHVAESMQSFIREDVDWIARYGGDEFVICLNNVDNDAACHIAKMISDSIDEVEIPIQNGFAKTSISMGIQTMYETELTANELIHMSDQKMYEAKRQKKGRLQNPCN